MALGSSNSNNYASIWTHSQMGWFKKSEESNPDSVPHTVKMGPRQGDVEYRIYHGAISGNITGAKFHHGDHGVNFNLTLTDEDEGDSYVLRMPVKKAFYQFARCVEDMDFSKFTNVLISKGKNDKVYLNVEQDGEWIKPRYGLGAEMGDCPPIISEEKRVDGVKKSVLNSEAQDSYLFDKVERLLVSKFETPQEDVPDFNKESNQAESNDDVDDLIPF